MAEFKEPQFLKLWKKSSGRCWLSCRKIWCNTQLTPITLYRIIRCYCSAHLYMAYSRRKFCIFSRASCIYCGRRSGLDVWYKWWKNLLDRRPIFYRKKKKHYFFGENVPQYHRTLTSYLNTLLKNGFKIREVIEPKSTPDMLKEIREIKEELRRPMMLVISVSK